MRVARQLTAGTHGGAFGASVPFPNPNGVQIVQPRVGPLFPLGGRHTIKQCTWFR